MDLRVQNCVIIQLRSRPEVVETRAFVLGWDPAFGNDAEVTGDDVARIRRSQEKGCVVFIARGAGGVCVGAGQASVPGGGLVEVGGIAVAETHRRRGIAGSLVAAIAAEAFARGVEVAWLEASGSDSWRVYERAGFKPMGQRLYIALENAG